MRSGAAPVVVVALPARSHPAAASPPTTAKSPYVTLQPASPSGGIPGDANDGADLWGGGAALIAIVLAIVVVRFLFHRGGQPVHVAERDDPVESRQRRRRGR